MPSAAPAANIQRRPGLRLVGFARTGFSVSCRTFVVQSDIHRMLCRDVPRVPVVPCLEPFSPPARLIMQRMRLCIGIRVQPHRVQELHVTFKELAPVCDQYIMEATRLAADRRS